MDLERRTWDEHRETGTPWTNNPLHPQLSQQTTLTPKKIWKERQVGISKQCRDNLKFLLFALKKCYKGDNLNAITYWCPTHAYRLDSCTAGLGGYSNKGFEWRYYFLQGLKFRMSNNLFEHLTAVITPWVDIIVGWLLHGYCTLLTTNNTTLAGWLKKTNFIKDGKDPI